MFFPPFLPTKSKWDDMPECLLSPQVVLHDVLEELFQHLNNCTESMNEITRSPVMLQ